MSESYFFITFFIFSLSMLIFFHLLLNHMFISPTQIPK